MRSISLVAVALVALLGTAPGALAASIEQNGDYTYTIVRENNGHGFSHTRALNAQQYDRLSGRLSLFTGQVQSKYARRAWHCAGTNSGNNAVLGQAGAENAASVSQFGSNDNATISQSGADNAAYALQFGSNLNSSTAQRGTHNLALTIQQRPCRANAFLQMETMVFAPQ